jgi:PIN domain nuclease of toxin-antitoxin system
MNLLLDTTYLLPAIGISVKGVQPDILTIIRKKTHQTSISELTLFELSAKGAKHAATGQLDAKRVCRGIQAVAQDEGLEKLPLLDPETLATSIQLRRILVDYIDCVILSTALSHCDALMTEDGLIQGLEEDGTYRNIVNETNPRFKLLTRRDLAQI